MALEDWIGNIDWVKFLICFVILVVFPVWILDLTHNTFLWKCGFTIAGIVGIWLFFNGKQRRGYSG